MRDIRLSQNIEQVVGTTPALRLDLIEDRFERRSYRRWRARRTYMLKQVLRATRATSLVAILRGDLVAFGVRNEVKKRSS